MFLRGACPVHNPEKSAETVSDEEITVRGVSYFRRLVEYIRQFGVELLQQHTVNDNIATLNAQLKASWDEDGVALRLQGLSWLAPVAISLDQPDLPAFVYEPMMRAAMQDQFAADPVLLVLHQLQHP